MKGKLMSTDKDTLLGKAKKTVGDAVNDKSLQEEGVEQETKGKIKEGIDKVADKMKEHVND